MISEIAEAIGPSQSQGQGLLPLEMKPWGFTPVLPLGLALISQPGAAWSCQFGDHICPSMAGLGSPFSLGVEGGGVRFLTSNPGWFLYFSKSRGRASAAASQLLPCRRRPPTRLSCLSPGPLNPAPRHRSGSDRPPPHLPRGLGQRRCPRVRILAFAL